MFRVKLLTLLLLIPSLSWSSESNEKDYNWFHYTGENCTTVIDKIENSSDNRVRTFYMGMSMGMLSALNYSVMVKNNKTITIGSDISPIDFFDRVIEACKLVPDWDFFKANIRIYRELSGFKFEPDLSLSE